jgi:hypothetical protein
MRHVVLLFIHFLATLVRLLGPGGVRSIVAESLLLKHQLLLLNRSRQRSPNLLTFLGHMKDRLWSIDLFRCESATLRTHWVLVVMDQYTRRIKQPSHAYLTEWANSRYARAATSRQSPFVSMATSLSILISDTHGCVIFQRLALAAASDRPRQNFQEIIRCSCIAKPFADPTVSLQRNAFRT